MAWVVQDLRYRVTKVTLWGSDDRFDGVQFFYHNFFNGDSREGYAIKTTRVSDEIKMTEVLLIEGEFITGVACVKSEPPAEKPSPSAGISGIVLVTSIGRHFRAGSMVEDASAVSAEPYTEVRELVIERSRSYDSFLAVTATLVEYPSPESLLTKVTSALEASESKWTYVKECEKLAIALETTHKELQCVMDRRVIYPVGAVGELADLADKSNEIITSCGDSYGFGYMWRRVSYISEYQTRLEKLTTYIKDQLRTNELTCVQKGDATGPLSSASVPTMIRLALDAQLIELAVELSVKYASYLQRADLHLVHAVVEGAVETGLSGSIVRVVEEFSKSVRTRPMIVMRQFKPLLLSRIIERVLEDGKPEPFEWLVTKAGHDPFDAPVPTAGSFGSSLIRQVSSVCHTALERAGVGSHVDPHQQRSLRRQTRHEKLCHILATLESRDDAERMQRLLDEIKHKEDFQVGLITLATKVDVVSADELYVLVPKITSVYDLPMLYSQAKSHLEATDKPGLVAIVKATCEHVLDKELTVDTHASLFFDAALKQALKLGYLTKQERNLYRRRNEHVNIVQAPCIQRLQNAFRELQWRVTRLDDQVDMLQRNVRDLRDCLRRKEEADLRRRRIRRGFALMSTILSMFGGHILTAIQDCVFDLPDSFDTLFASAGETDDASTALVAADDAPDLGLGDEADQLIDNDDTADLTTASAKEHAADETGFRADVVRALKEAKINPHDFLELTNEALMLSCPQSIVHGKRVSFDEATIRQFPYHNAVRESRGDLQEYKKLEAAVKKTKADPHARMSVTVIRVHDDGSKSSTTAAMESYVFASHLGFVAIVEHLYTTQKAKRHNWQFWKRTRHRAEKAEEGHAAIAG